jgi:hypothetical protein
MYLALKRALLKVDILYNRGHFVKLFYILYHRQFDNSANYNIDNVLIIQLGSQQLGSWQLESWQLESWQLESWQLESWQLESWQLESWQLESWQLKVGNSKLAT